MIVTIDNRSPARIPRAFLQRWVDEVVRELKHRRVASLGPNQELRLIFLTAPEMKKLNKKFRDGNYATDVLSFESDEPDCFGELVICPSVIVENAAAHGLSRREEYAYMVLHGVLHLLGYDHEKSGSGARAMFALQDSLFEKLLP